MCISPFVKKDEKRMRKNQLATIKVPCGKCMECLARRRNDWSFRLYHQMNVSESACFMTLTYGEHQKLGFGSPPPLSPNGLQTLQKRDVQLFLKRLRKHQKNYLGNEDTIKYYAVGEYGTHTHRPHYHIIMFNLDHRLLLNSIYIGRKLWTHGLVDVTTCNIATICYTVGYILKGVWSPWDDLDDREPEFSIMSKRLGSSYLTDEIYSYHSDRLETTVMHPSGFRMPLPRYFRDQVFDEDQRKEIQDYHNAVMAINWKDWANSLVRDKHSNDAKIRKHEKELILKRATL